MGELYRVQQFRGRKAEAFGEDLVQYRALEYDPSQGDLRYVQSDRLGYEFSKVPGRVREYYAYFRHCVSEGRYPDTDLGYLWLLVSETVLGDAEPLAEQDLLVRLCENYRHSHLALLSNLVLEHAVWRNLPIPKIDCYDDLSLLLGYCIRKGAFKPIPSKVIFNLIGEDKYILDSEKETVAELVNLCMPRVLEQERSYGMGYLTGTRGYTAPYSVLSRLPLDVGEIDCRLRYEGLDFASRILRVMVRTAVRTLHNRKTGRCYPASRDYPVTVEIVETATRNHMSDHEAGGKPKLYSMSVSKELECVILPSERIRVPRTEAEACRYIESHGIGCAFDHIPPGSRSYYLYWRKCFEEGKPKDADIGYLALYLSELFDDRSDPQRSIDSMEALKAAYGEYSQVKGLLNTALLTYRRITGFFAKGKQSEEFLCAYNRLCRDGVGGLRARELAVLAGLKGRFANVVTEEVAGLTRACLEEAERIKKYYALDSLEDMFWCDRLIGADSPPIAMSQETYDEIMSFAIIDESDAEEGVEFFRTILELVLRMKSPDRAKLFKIDPDEFGQGYIDMVESVVSKGLSIPEPGSEKAPEPPPEPVRLVLDMSEVEKAEDDLGSVREIMSPSNRR